MRAFALPVTSLAQVWCWWRLEGAGAAGHGRRVLFSGDLGHYDQPIIRDPVAPPACDYLLSNQLMAIGFTIRRIQRLRWRE